MGDLRTALVSSVQEAGVYATKARGRLNKKVSSIQDIEKRCHSIISREIRSCDPQISVWGDDGQGRGVAVICPIDSVLNFARGFDYSVMAAYCEDGVPVIAAIHFPNTEQIYVAEEGNGTRVDGRRINTNERQELHGALISCHCNDYSDERDSIGIAVLYALSEKNVAWRNLGSPGAEYCFVAEGKLDGIIVPSADSMHAAGYLIAKEAGAEVSDWRGKDVSIFSQAVVAANSKLHAKLIDVLCREL